MPRARPVRASRAQQRTIRASDSSTGLRRADALRREAAPPGAVRDLRCDCPMADGDEVDLSFLEDDDPRRPDTGNGPAVAHSVLENGGAPSADDQVAAVAADLEDLEFEEDDADVDVVKPASAIENSQQADGDDDAEASVDPYDQSQLPPHACAYCGIHDPACVLQDVKSKKWFCNATGQMPGSHIVTHLMRSRSREVRLHKDSPLGGESVLECYACSSTNVFLLGFVPAQGDSVVMLLCREPCLHQKGLDDLKWDVSAWQPLIVDRQFLSWVVAVPSKRDVSRARQITRAQAYKLEEMWKENPNATLEDTEKAIDADELPKTQGTYEDGYQFQSVLGALIRAEAENDRRMKQEQSRTSLTVRWDVGGLNKRRVAYFVSDIKVLNGDELTMKHEGRKWECVGTVKGYTANEEIALELRPGKSSAKAPTEIHSGFSIDVVWKATSFDRMHAAMRTFAVNETSVSGYLFHKILGHEVAEQVVSTGKIPDCLSAPGLPELNPSQEISIRAVLRSPLSLIQGPPGTGKTVTSATIVYHLAKTTRSQILVCAPSNIAVDQLAEKISMTGLKVVRVVAKSRESLPAGSVEHLSLHYQVRHLDDREESELNKLMRLRDELGELNERDDRRLKTLRRQTEKELLSAADVICTTCVAAGDPRMASIRFRCVLVDEATQATEPEALIPIVHGCKQLVFVGDQCQLGPVITDKRAAAAGLGQSMFERLHSLGTRPIRLEVQYRMHPSLSKFPSTTFYEGSLQNGVSAEERQTVKKEFPWIDPCCPMMFWSQQGLEEVSASGTSFLNRIEAQVIETSVTHMLRNGVKPSRIGVITPYEGQRAHIVSHFGRAGSLRPDLYREIEVASVDSFQGREKDYIILSCVRSNDNQGIGFLADPRRLNVALTRARLGNLLVGNPKVLAKQPLWASLLAHFKEEGVLVEGPLNSLKQSLISIPRPKRRGNGEFARRTPLPPISSSASAREHSLTSGSAAALRDGRGHSNGVRATDAVADLSASTGAFAMSNGRATEGLMNGSHVPLPQIPFGVVGSLFSQQQPISQAAPSVSPFTSAPQMPNANPLASAAVDAARARGDLGPGGDPRNDYSFHHTPGWK